MRPATTKRQIAMNDEDKKLLAKYERKLNLIREAVVDLIDDELATADDFIETINWISDISSI